MATNCLSQDSNSADLGVYDREKEVREFDAKKIGLKGLVDAGMTKIPRFFHAPPDGRTDPNEVVPGVELPVIDLRGINGEGRKGIVEQMGRASESWGFFQIVNHGIPIEMIDEMREGIRRFNEQPLHEKMKFYSHDVDRKVNFSTNYDILRAKATDWRDSLLISLDSGSPTEPEELPAICRDITVRYVESVLKLGETLSELLSEALGLEKDHLKNMDCVKAMSIVSHYSPPCPEPELTMGTRKHADPTFLTILSQSMIGGLQVKHNDEWINATPIPGAFVINIGDLFQIMTNGRFKSVHHRVLGNKQGPRISMSSFLNPHRTDTRLICGPIKELLSETNPPIYRNISAREYFDYVVNREFVEDSADHFKL